MQQKLLTQNKHLGAKQNLEKMLLDSTKMFDRKQDHRNFVPNSTSFTIIGEELLF
jgi:predicted SPOUT superfamily RNA methylase MTH1